jgi:pimeloyl-ACP methyl ester carboxylesterase
MAHFRITHDTSKHVQWGLGLPVLLAGLCLPAVVAAQPAPANGRRTCTQAYVPVPTAQIPEGILYGELCRPSSNSWPSKVQLLVHGTGHNRYLWDFPLSNGAHSHVQRSLDAGWATFNIDKIGTGKSTIPADPTTLSVASTVESLHVVAQRLRSGTLCDDGCGAPAFEKVVYVGHSLSTAIGWQHGRVHPDDFDAFVLLGLVHATTPAFLGLALQLYVPTTNEPLFQSRNLHPGYVTTLAWSRGQILINPDNADPGVFQLDEVLKDIASWPMTFETASRFAFTPDPCSVPGNDTPSCYLTKPVYLMLGEFDQPSCGGGGPLPTCSAQSVQDFERAFYSPAANLKVKVVPNAGHAIQIERGYDGAFDWLMGQMTGDGF